MTVKPMLIRTQISFDCDNQIGIVIDGFTSGGQTGCVFIRQDYLRQTIAQMKKQMKLAESAAINSRQDNATVIGL